MVFNVLLTGVGGEGVLFASVLVARAANLEGYEVRGTQLHGLAQRGGQIPTHVRFGEHGHVFSPTIPRAEADLVLGLEPVEAARSCYFADKGRTCFLVDTYPIVPVYAGLLGEGYPSMEGVRRMIEPFAKRMVFADASNICSEKLGDTIYGNAMAIGIAVSQGLLPLKEGSLSEAIRRTAGRYAEMNLRAFRLGLGYRGETQ